LYLLKDLIVFFFAKSIIIIKNRIKIKNTPTYQFIFFLFLKVILSIYYSQKIKKTRVVKAIFFFVFKDKKNHFIVQKNIYTYQ